MPISRPISNVTVAEGGGPFSRRNKKCQEPSCKMLIMMALMGAIR